MTTVRSRPSWNPLRMTGTDLSPQLLLMVKLVVIGLFLKNYHLQFPNAFAPMFDWMNVFPDPWFRRAFKVVFVLSAIALLFNRSVRTNCLIIGALILIGTLASKPHYTNAKVFAGLLFLLTGLQDRDRPPRLIWWQLSIMYFGAGLNKFFEPDWRSGQYFAHFLGEIHPSAIYGFFAPLLPGIWTAKLMCWSIIAAELVAGLMFASDRFRSAAVCVATSVHAGAAILVMGDYGIYLVAVLASYLSCLSWPERIDVRVSSRSRWRRVAEIASRLDPDRRTSWDVHEESAGPAIQLSALGRSWSGWASFGCLIVWTPAVYLVAVVVLTAFEGATLRAIIRVAGILAMTIVLCALGLKLRNMRSEVGYSQA